MKILTGIVRPGTRGATPRTSDVIDEIRERTGFRGLRAGTLNVTLAEPHTFRPDFTLLNSERREPDHKGEDWSFEVCRIGRHGRSLPTLILHTSTNFHGDNVLEIMAEEHLRDWLPANDDDRVEVTVYENAEEIPK